MDETYQNFRVLKTRKTQIREVIGKTMTIQAALDQLIEFGLAHIITVEPGRILFKEVKSKKEKA